MNMLTAQQSSNIHLPDTGEQLPGFYIHIPFCKSKCAYCSFTSYQCVGQPPEEYLNALMRQASVMAEHPWAQDRIFASLFIGGGTPTIYDHTLLAELITNCLSLFNFVDQPEVTVETNPNTISFEKLVALKYAGVNRLSIGVQSFSDKVLKAIGRSHSVADTHNAITMAREVGFDTINLDCIYGLPNQTLEDWEYSLDAALGYEPEHLALYELMIEEGTPFAERARTGELQLPSEETVIKMADIAQEKLIQSGFMRYEISNFCKPCKQCLHNINYWENGSYLGLGAAAVSCFSGLRIKNVSDPDVYVSLVNEARAPFFDAECLSLEARFRETIIMGLRMLLGVSIDSLQERFGLTPQEYYGETLNDLLQQELIKIEDDKLRLTRKGLPVANQVLSQLV